MNNKDYNEQYQRLYNILLGPVTGYSNLARIINSTIEEVFPKMGRGMKQDLTPERKRKKKKKNQGNEESKDSLFLSEKQIRDARNENSSTGPQPINCFLFYLGIQHKKWPYYNGSLDTPPPIEILTDDRMLGVWHLYRLDDDDKEKESEVKQTTLLLDYTKQKYVAYYYSIHETKFREGTIEQIGKILLIRLHNEDHTHSITIHVEVEDWMLKEENPVLNAFLISSADGAPYMRQLVMRHTGEKSINIENEYVWIVRHSSQFEGKPPAIEIVKKESKERFIQNKDLDPIVEFLHREPGTRYAKPFRPASLKGVQTRNKDNISENDPDYEELKNLFLGVSWFSLSRIDSDHKKISVFEWKFQEDKLHKVIIATRIRNGESKTTFQGPVKLRNSYFYFDLKEQKQDPRQKRLIAERRADTKSTILLCISLTISNLHEKLAVREILLNSDESILKNSKTGQISYESFLKLNCLSDKEQLFLVSRAESTLSYPSAAAQLDNRLLVAKNGNHGKYFIYILN